jgi:hypothetical protein
VVPCQAILHAPPSLFWSRGTARLHRLGDLLTAAGIGGEAHPRDVVLLSSRPRRHRLHTTCAHPTLGESWRRGDRARPVVAAGLGVEASARDLDAGAGVASGGGGGLRSLALSHALHPEREHEFLRARSRTYVFTFEGVLSQFNTR